MIELTKAQIEQWIESEEPEFSLNELRQKYQIDPTSKTLNMSITRMIEEGKIKRVGRGIYKKIKKVRPVEWHNVLEGEPLPFKFPTSHRDDTHFNLDHAIKLYPGDLIVCAGMGNAGKSCFSKNILGENIDLFEQRPVLMGNEYTNADGVASGKFVGSIRAMDWMVWHNGNGPKFDLLPVKEDWEDYVRKDTLNIIDWINLTDNFYKIGQIIEDIKVRIGQGLAVVVIQKDADKHLGRGGGFTEDMADVYLEVDVMEDFVSRLSIGKVKVAKGKVKGRSWSFRMDYGSVISEIHEVVRCTRCWGKKPMCMDCGGTGYSPKYDDPIAEFGV